MTPGEREVSGLLDPLELARHAQVDLESGEPLSELPRLLHAGLGQPALDRRVAVDSAGDAELALAVSGEDHLVHLAYFKSIEESSRRMKRTK